MPVVNPTNEEHIPTDFLHQAIERVEQKLPDFNAIVPPVDASNADVVQELSVEDDNEHAAGIEQNSELGEEEFVALVEEMFGEEPLSDEASQTAGEPLVDFESFATEAQNSDDAQPSAVFNMDNTEYSEVVQPKILDVSAEQLSGVMLTQNVRQEVQEQPSTYLVIDQLDEHIATVQNEALRESSTELLATIKTTIQEIQDLQSTMLADVRHYDNVPPVISELLASEHEPTTIEVLAAFAEMDIEDLPEEIKEQYEELLAKVHLVEADCAYLIETLQIKYDIASHQLVFAAGEESFDPMRERLGVLLPVDDTMSHPHWPQYIVELLGRLTISKHPEHTQSDYTLAA